MADITEVIHKIVYEVDDAALQRAAAVIRTQINELATLTNQLNKYKKELDATSVAETSAISKLSQHINITGKQLEASAGKTKGILSQMGQGFLEGFGLKGGGIVAVTAQAVEAVKQLGIESFKSAAKVEELANSLNLVVNNANATDILVKNLQDIAVRSPFDLDELGAAAKQLLDIGLSADELLPVLEQLGDVASETGKEKLPELVQAFGQVRTEGVLTEDTLQQLKSAGFDPLQLIADKTGTSLRQLRKDLDNGKIGFNAVEEALRSATSEGGKFFGMMERSSNTTNGAIGNLKDAFENLKATIGDATTGPVKGFVEGLTDIIKGWNDLIAIKPEEALKREQDELNSLVYAIVGANKETGERSRLMGELNQKFPDFLGNLDAEKVKNNELIAILNQVNQKYQLRFSLIARQKIAQEKADKAEARRDDYEKQLKKLAPSFQNAMKKGLLTQDEVTQILETGSFTPEQEARLQKEAGVSVAVREDDKAISYRQTENGSAAQDALNAIARLKPAKEKYLQAQKELAEESKKSAAAEAEIAHYDENRLKEVQQQLKTAKLTTKQREELEAEEKRLNYNIQQKNKPATVPSYGTAIPRTRRKLPKKEVIQPLQPINSIKELPVNIEQPVFQTVDADAILKAEQERQRLEQEAKDKAAQEHRREQIKKSIDAYQQLADAATQAFQTIYEAQIKALDKEIAIRQKRVDEAMKLAERGNTEVLRQEEERLKETQKKREQYARREQVVNAAVTISNAIVAIAKAAAEGAGQGGYGAIATVAATIAALAAGYAAVQSLSNNSESFKDGVVDYHGAGGPRDDANWVRISSGESVITAGGTKANRHLLEAINNGTQFRVLDPALAYTMPAFRQPQQLQQGAYASAQDMQTLERKLDDVVSAIEDNRMKQDIFFNEHGVGLLTERAIRKNNRRFR